MKRTFHKLLTSTIIVFSLFGCTYFKVVTRNPKDGYFKYGVPATVVKAENVLLDSLKTLIVVPKNDFMIGMTKNLNYFDEVISLEDLEKRVIAAKLQNDIPAINNLIGLSKVHNLYKPFLYLSVSIDRKSNKNYGQLKLLNPKTGNELFISEIQADYVSDQAVWYPLYNSLVDYLRNHSKVYK